jgi:ketosteroid isomerase-like protein
MEVTAGADVAFAFASMRCEGPGSDGEPEALDFRLTTCLSKIDGRWMIAHEHHSVPATD